MIGNIYKRKVCLNYLQKKKDKDYLQEREDRNYLQKKNTITFTEEFFSYENLLDQIFWIIKFGYISVGTFLFRQIYHVTTILYSFGTYILIL